VATPRASNSQPGAGKNARDTADKNVCATLVYATALPRRCAAKLVFLGAPRPIFTNFKYPKTAQQC